MALPFPSMNFVPLDVLTAEEQNQLVANIEALANGSGLDDGSVTAAKLAEAFFRGRYQDNTTNSAPTGLTLQHGWGFIPGDGDDTATEVVTFPVAFSTLHSITTTALGQRVGSDPTAITDFSAGQFTAAAINPSLTGFTALAAIYSGASFSSNIRAGYSWQALGIV